MGIENFISMMDFVCQSQVLERIIDQLMKSIGKIVEKWRMEMDFICACSFKETQLCFRTNPLVRLIIEISIVLFVMIGIHLDDNQQANKGDQITN